MSRGNWIYLENVTIKKETEKAFLVEMKDGHLWIPKSQMSQEDMESNNYKEGDKGLTIAVTEWFANKEGLV